MIEFYFPHELATAELDIPAPPGPATVSVFKNGVASETPWASHDLVGGKLPLDFVAQAVFTDTLTKVDSPFLVKGPIPPEGTVPPPPKPHQQLSAKGKLGINFGKDKLTITFALNGGGGAAATGGAGGGAVVGASGGQGGAVTVNAKWYSITPVFEVGALLKSDDTVIIALRCLLRYFIHWCDAIDLAIDFVKTKLPSARDAGDVMSSFLGFNWWMTVFSIFAMKDMLFDIVADETEFIASLLDKIGIEVKLDLNVAGNFDLEAGVDASGTVSGRVYVPLAIMLAPIIEFLMAGSSAPAPSGGSLADKIVPFVEGKIEERVSVAIGAMPAAMMVECKGLLAKCTFAVPKGSPLRAKLEEVGEGIGKAADHYKNGKRKQLREETKLLRLVLELVDHEVANIVKLVRAAQSKSTKQASDALSSGFAAATPYVAQILAALKGTSTPEPPGVSPAAQAVVDMLERTKVHGISLGTVGPLEVADNGEHKMAILHVEDDEKAAIQSAGFDAVSIDAELETTTLELGLPGRPAAIAWNHLSKNPRLANEYAGIVAGFDDTGARDAMKKACRDRGWIPDELGTFQDQHPDDSEGMHWAWVSVGLSRALASRQPPVMMPELELTESGKLRLTFDEMPIGSIPDGITEDIALLQGAAITRTRIWKVVLLDSATSDEIEHIRAQVDANQPSEDPYETALDDLLEGAGNSDTAGDTDAQFARLGTTRSR